MMGEKVKEPQSAVKKKTTKHTKEGIKPVIGGHRSQNHRAALARCTVLSVPEQKQLTHPTISRDQLTPAIQDNLGSFLHGRRTLMQSSEAQKKYLNKREKKKEGKKTLFMGGYKGRRKQ